MHYNATVNRGRKHREEVLHQTRASKPCLYGSVVDATCLTIVVGFTMGIVVLGLNPLSALTGCWFEFLFGDK